jgi:hypothetical protein
MRTRCARHFGQSAISCHGSGFAFAPALGWPSIAPGIAGTAVLQKGHASGASALPVARVPAACRQPSSLPPRGIGESSSTAEDYELVRRATTYSRMARAFSSESTATLAHVPLDSGTGVPSFLGSRFTCAVRTASRVFLT